MNLNEVVGEVIESRCRSMVPQLAAKSIRKMGIAPHLGSDGPVLSLDVAGRDVFGVRVPVASIPPYPSFQLK